MSQTSIDKLYVISYLLKRANDNAVLGYSDLAARVQYLCTLVEKDEKITDSVTRGLEEMVGLSEDNMLEWDSLKNFVEGARTDQIGSMFLNVQTEEVEPNEWVYKFESNAPESVLEEKIEKLSERDEALKQKIHNAATVDREKMYDQLYKA